MTEITTALPEGTAMAGPLKRRWRWTRWAWWWGRDCYGTTDCFGRTAWVRWVWVEPADD